MTRAELSSVQMIAALVADGAQDLATKKKYGDAFENFAKARSIDPNNYTIHTGLAELCSECGEFESTLKYMMSAVEIAPRCADIDKLKGDILAANNAKERDIVAAYKSALAKPSRDAFLMLDLSRRLDILDLPVLKARAERKFVSIARNEGIVDYLNATKNNYYLRRAPKGGELQAMAAFEQDFFPAHRLLGVEHLLCTSEQERVIKDLAAVCNSAADRIARMGKDMRLRIKKSNVRKISSNQ